MSEAKVCQVTPGVCPPEGCPPPTRIECIVVNKVYDSCFQIHDFARDTTITDFTPDTFDEGDVIECSQNGEITCSEISRVDAGGGFFTVTILVSVPVTLTNPNDPTETIERTFTFTKTATLCCPPGTTPDCSESSVIFCSCVITGVNSGSITVTCTLQVCVVIKCILEVQLLVPSYGFCVPAPCITLPGVCPPTPPAQCF
jgi:hypothetical protein